MSVRAPRNQAQATALLERYAALESDLAEVEGNRNGMIAHANQLADQRAVPLLAELQALAAKIEPWWLAARAQIAGKRKSIELGGCMIGTRQSRAQLAHNFLNDEAAIAALKATRLFKQTTRVRFSIDRTATLKLVQGGGKTGQVLTDLGFRAEEGEEAFFVQRVEQEGTLG